MVKKNNKLLPLLAQEKTILKYFPESKTAIVGKKLIWKGYLQPTPFSKKYEIKINYEAGKISIYVLNPKLDICEGQKKLPHIYNAKKQQLCLFFKEWNGGMFIIDTIIPWTSEWLYFYEIWLVNGGIWLGGGTTHNNTIPKKQ